MSRILVIGDIHEPATHPGYLAWCKHLHEKWECNKVVMIGDVLDYHAISFHAREIDAPNSDQEYDLSHAAIARWREAFPVVDAVCIGNHDERVHRLAASVSIPARFIRSFSDLWKTPGWNWVREAVIDRCLFIHGTGFGGQQPAATAARAAIMNVALGHVHSVGGVRRLSTASKDIWGMDTGCGVDIEAVGMRYGRNMISKPVLGAGVVLDGEPIHFAMPCRRGQEFHRSRFRRKKR